MMLSVFINLYAQDLSKLRNEIQAFQSEQNLWLNTAGIHNSAGNLCLHLVGNLNTYIGFQLGQIPYIRNREQEFLLRDIPQTELLARVEDTRLRVGSSLELLDPTSLSQEHSFLVWEEKTSIEFLLTRLYGHFHYHLGQINYLRRILEAS
jgi:hypothetical protein